MAGPVRRSWLLSRSTPLLSRRSPLLSCSTPKYSRTESSVVFSSSIDCANRLRDADNSSSCTLGSGTIVSTVMLPSVIVPVLSRQSTSTLARFSTQYKSCTRVWWRERRTTLTASAMLTKSTMPPGIMAEIAATVRTIASVKLCSTRKKLFQTKRAARGMMAIAMTRTISLTDFMITELDFL